MKQFRKNLCNLHILTSEMCISGDFTKPYSRRAKFGRVKHVNNL